MPSIALSTSTLALLLLKLRWGLSLIVSLSKPIFSSYYKVNNALLDLGAIDVRGRRCEPLGASRVRNIVDLMPLYLVGVAE